MEVVAAVIKDDFGKIFCCRRGPGRALAGYLEFPGGKIERYESNEEALKREIFEELSSEILVEELIETVKYDYKNTHINMHVYFCKLVRGSLELSEHTEKFWLEASKLNEESFAPADRSVVRKLKKIAMNLI